jgi:hypothetical protein
MITKHNEMSHSKTTIPLQHNLFHYLIFNTKNTDIVWFCIMTPHNLVVGTSVEEHDSNAGGPLKIHIVHSSEAFITSYQTAIMNIHHCENMK